MKKIQKLCFLALVGLMVGTSCEKTTQAPDPNPQDKCIEGVVIATFSTVETKKFSHSRQPKLEKWEKDKLRERKR